MTAYEKIYERAADNYGYITTKEAAEIGVPKSEMSALAKIFDNVGNDALKEYQYLRTKVRTRSFLH